MPGRIKDVVGDVYENFLMRDLTFVFSGSLLLASAKYAYGGKLIDTIDLISENGLTFIIFLAISYFIGLIIQEGFLIFQEFVAKVFKTEKRLVKMDLNSAVLMARIYEKYGFDPIRRIERTSYLKQVGAAIGFASLISAFILLFNEFYICALIFFVITIVCIFENRNKYDKQSRTLKYFEAQLEKDK